MDNELAEYIGELETLIDDLMKALEKIQWGTEELCAECGNFSGDGHAVECPIRAAIESAKS